MSTATQPTSIIEAFRGFVPYRMSIEQYEAMVALDVFTRDDRFELIEGLLVAKMTKYPPHSVATDLCGKILDRLVNDKGWHARIEKPIRIPTRSSEPEPDVVLARGELATYWRRHPNPEDIALIVEVADTTLEKDRRLAKTYGAGGIPVYWIINLADRQVEVYSSPKRKAYTIHETLLETEFIDLIIEGRMMGRIAVAELLPPRESIS
jgi:Uma2 family endonuclease